MGGRPCQAHRYVYSEMVGAIPYGYDLDHLCRVRHCVNPTHLEPVTHRDNILRGVSFAARYARQERCKHGHEMIVRTYGGHTRRICLPCGAAASRRYYAVHKRGVA